MFRKPLVSNLFNRLYMWDNLHFHRYHVSYLTSVTVPAFLGPHVQLYAEGPRTSAPENIANMAKTRECDLLQAQSSRIQEAIQCWTDGLRVFPHNALMYNELGNLHAQVQ